MYKFTLIRAEWNSANSLLFEIIAIETPKLERDRALFSINVHKTFLIIDFLFFNFVVFDKTEWKIKD